MNPPRRIAHLDMDAFYASVELLRYPELRGLPVVIGGSRDQQPLAPRRRQPPFRAPARLRRPRRDHHRDLRSARARRLFGDGHHESRQAAPDAILLPVDFAPIDTTRACSKPPWRNRAAIEDRGIDEIYIDLSEHYEPGESPDALRALAQRIKDAVRVATGLSCSIGVAANKLLAKIASELDKPDGLTLLAASDLAKRIWPLPVRKINGIGPKTDERLAALGIHRIGDLAALPAPFLQQHFGRAYGGWLLAAAHGIDDRPLVLSSEPKSISRETTFERDLDPRADRETLNEIFTTLCAGVADDLRRKACLGRTIGIKLRFADFQTLTRDLTLATATADAQQIRRAARECLRRVTLDRKLRLLGVRVSALVPLGSPEDQPRQGQLLLCARS
jgi:DNA polymerase-4